MEKRELTNKMVVEMRVISNYEEGVSSKRLFEENKDTLKKGTVETLNSSTATASALASKGYVEKFKKMDYDKLLTFFKITPKGLDYLKSITEKEEN